MAQKPGRMVARELSLQSPVVSKRTLVAAVASLIQVLPIQVAPPVPISYGDARPILERLATILPSELRAKSATEIESVWVDWVARRNADIRARLERGDEDSVINFLLFGTTFTRLPRALNDSAQIGGRERAAEIVRGRLADLTAALASPGTNERLLFARALVQRRGIDPATASDEIRRGPTSRSS